MTGIVLDGLAALGGYVLAGIPWVVRFGPLAYLAVAAPLVWRGWNHDEEWTAIRRALVNYMLDRQ